MNVFRTFVNAALAALAVPVLAATPVTATLTLLPETTLPGVPVSFLITVTNPSDAPVRLDGNASLRITTATGSFDATDPWGHTMFNLPPHQVTSCGSATCFTVPAHGQYQIYVDVDPTLGGNYFFVDRRLSFPGTYLLDLSLYTAPATNGETPEGIHANRETLTVQQPEGTDLAVWNLLLQLSTRKGWGDDDWAINGDTLADGLRANFPTSTYTMRVAARGRGHSCTQAVSFLDQALATSLPTAFRDDLLWAKGDILNQCSHAALTGDRDLATAVAYADQARSVLTTLRDSAVTDLYRQYATKTLSNVMSRQIAAETLDWYAKNDPPAPARVIPRVECVTKGAGQTFSATFGYTNPNRTNKVLQIPADNHVTPAPVDQGQPRVFRSGSHSNVFTASSPGGNLIWHLDGGEAVATPDFSVQCVPATITAARTQ